MYGKRYLGLNRLAFLTKSCNAAAPGPVVRSLLRSTRSCSGCGDTLRSEGGGGDDVEVADVVGLGVSGNFLGLGPTGSADPGTGDCGCIVCDMRVKDDSPGGEEVDPDKYHPRLSKGALSPSGGLLSQCLFAVIKALRVISHSRPWSLSFRDTPIPTISNVVNAWSALEYTSNSPLDIGRTKGKLRSPTKDFSFRYEGATIVLVV